MSNARLNRTKTSLKVLFIVYLKSNEQLYFIKENLNRDIKGLREREIIIIKTPILFFKIYLKNCKLRFNLIG